MGVQSCLLSAKDTFNLSGIRSAYDIYMIHDLQLSIIPQSPLQLLLLQKTKNWKGVPKLGAKIFSQNQRVGRFCIWRNQVIACWKF